METKNEVGEAKPWRKQPSLSQRGWRPMEVPLTLASSLLYEVGSYTDAVHITYRLPILHRVITRRKKGKNAAGSIFCIIPVIASSKLLLRSRFVPQSLPLAHHIMFHPVQACTRLRPMWHAV